MPKDIVCKVCGKTFTVTRKKRYDTARFCSKACHGIWRGEFQQGENNPVWRGGNIKKECMVCKSTFTTDPSRSYRKCCSRSCAGIFRTANRERYYIDCAWCDKAFEVPCHRMKTARFCSTYCYQCWSSKNLNGPNSANWRGGHVPEPYGIEFNVVLKNEIRLRDKYSCQLCEAPEIKRVHDCHHIDYDKQNNAKSNLIFLCRRCHSRTRAGRSSWQRLFEFGRDNGGLLNSDSGNRNYQAIRLQG